MRRGILEVSNLPDIDMTHGVEQTWRTCKNNTTSLKLPFAPPASCAERYLQRMDLPKPLRFVHISSTEEFALVP